MPTDRLRASSYGVELKLTLWMVMTEFVSQPAPPEKAQMLARLEAVVDGMDRVAVAVSGGVDSLTLAHIAALTVGDRAMMHHATSPAVPQAATERTISLAQTYGWQLDIF